jgi:hypothetical protein
LKNQYLTFLWRKAAAALAKHRGLLDLRGPVTLSPELNAAMVQLKYTLCLVGLTE